MSERWRSRLSKVLLFAGISLFFAVGLYEAVNFPWQGFLARRGFVPPVAVESLAPPAPLPRDLIDPSDPEAPPAPDEALPQPPTASLTRPKVTLHQLGIIKIPAISLSAHLLAGTGDEMYYGVGHLTGSALPGQAGNCVLAGHRNHILAHAFRHLDKLEPGDPIYLTYGDETFVYEVYQSLVVSPEEVWVTALQDGESHMLTLITCTPTLNPTHRLIVWARLAAPDAG